MVFSFFPNRDFDDDLIEKIRFVFHEHILFAKFFLMDEITLVNLLNKICEYTDSLDWKLNCNYLESMDASVMEVVLFDRANKKKHGELTFQMETSSVIAGKYKSLMPFTKKADVVDALLDILHYETTTRVLSYN